jgi:hypothetical protein
MSELSSSGTEKTGPTKPVDVVIRHPTSPARNIIGLIVLIGVIGFGVYEYSAKSGFNRAVAALNARAKDENQMLLTVAEAEKLFGREPDGPAAEFKEGPWSFTTRTYTWPGLLKRYTVTAYYTKEKDSRLHHYETEGQKYDLEAGAIEAPSPPQASTGPAPKGQLGKSGNRTTSPPPQPKIAPESKTPSAGPGDKGSKAKPQPAVDKAPAGKPSEPSDKGSTDKP